MKKFIVGASALLASTQAFAGNIVEPMMEPEIVEASTTSSGGGLLVPILLTVILVAIIAGGGSDSVPAYPE